MASHYNTNLSRTNTSGKPQHSSKVFNSSQPITKKALNSSNPIPSHKNIETKKKPSIKLSYGNPKMPQPSPTA